MILVSANASALSIKGPDEVEVGKIYEYDVDAEYALEMTWQIQGGDIIDIERMSTPFYGPNDIRDFAAAPTAVKIGNYVKVFLYSVSETVSNTLNVHTDKTPKIKVVWYSSNGRLDASAYKVGIIGTGGTVYASLETIDCSKNRPNIAMSNTTMKCTGGVQAEAKPLVMGYAYTWSSPDATKTSDWGSGAYFEGVTKGSGQAKFVMTVNGTNANGKCPLTNFTKEAYVNVELVKAPSIYDNVAYKTLINKDTIAIKCDGSYSLTSPYYHPRAKYSWKTNDRDDIISNTSNLSYSLPTDLLFDIYGTLSISGVCGTQEQNFVLPYKYSVTLPPNIKTCNLNYNLQAYVPKGQQIYSWYSTQGGISLTPSADKRSVQISVSSPGEYDIYAVTSNSCDNVKSTKISFGESKGTINTGTLSSTRFRAASDLALVEDKVAFTQTIYFVGMDGDIYKYEFDKTLSSWILHKTGWVSDAKIPDIDGEFEPFVYNPAVNELIYKATDGTHYGFNITTKTRFPYIGLNDAKTIKVAKIQNSGYYGGMVAVDQSNNVKELLPYTYDFNLKTRTDRNKSLFINSFGYFYFNGGNLYLNGTILLANANPLATTLIEANGAYVYYTAADGKLWKVEIASPSNKRLMSGTQKCSGVFVIQRNGDVYFGVKGYNWETALYEGNVVNGQTVVTKLTEREHDSFFASPIYSYPHVYYITDDWTEDFRSNPQEVSYCIWNIYQNSGCGSSVRKAESISEEKVVNMISVYPNPVSDIITISLGDLADDQVSVVELTDVSGSKVVSFKGSVFSIEDVLPGIYVLIINTEKGKVYHQKIIKE